MAIRKFRKADLSGVSALIRRTFSEFNSREATKEGTKLYLELMSLSNPQLLTSYMDSTSYVYCEGKKLFGVVRAKEDMVKNLFVDGRHHGKAIGTRLLEKAESEIWKKGHKSIRIRSSIYAVPFYLRRGYKKTTGVRSFHGLRIQPMMKRDISK